MPAQHVCNTATTTDRTPVLCPVLSCPCLPWTIVAFIVIVLVLVVVAFMPQCPSKYLLFQRRPFAGTVCSATATLCSHLHASLASILSCTSSFYCCCCFYCLCQRGVSFQAVVPSLRPFVPVTAPSCPNVALPRWPATLCLALVHF